VLTWKIILDNEDGGFDKKGTVNHDGDDRRLVISRDELTKLIQEETYKRVDVIVQGMEERILTHMQYIMVNNHGGEVGGNDDDDDNNYGDKDKMKNQ
jgi:hypothetical protein